MKFSLNLINKYIDISNIPIKKLVDRLVFSGFEVEEYHQVASGTKLVIGQIISCVDHPNSDHLHLLKVDCGKKYGELQIVCGAKNAREGIKVIVARVGAYLPSINLTINESVIRGQKSCGMCCSLTELGVDKSLLTDSQINGIEEVDSSIKVGEEKVLKVLGLDDTIIDVNVLPNRGDILSYFGLVRELSSLFSIPVNSLPATNKILSKNDKSLVEVKTDLCPRFDVVKVDSVIPSSTPEYVKKALLISGIRPISSLVDLGNYAMLLTGQPFNIYDADFISKKFVIKDDITSSLTTFDGKKMQVKNGDIVICDKDKPVCIAGIMALKNASVNNSTKNIYIEAAVFSHKAIRSTSNRLGLSSYSSNLFAKGRNMSLVDEALSTIISLLPEFTTNFKVTSYSSNYTNNLKNMNPIFTFSLDKLNQRLGGHYTKEEVKAVLDAYNIKQLPNNKLQAPIYRNDIVEQCDIEEEVFRYYSVDKLDINFDSYPKTYFHVNSSLIHNEKIISNYLINNGFYRILSYTLIDEKKDKLIRVFSDKESFKVRNAMTSDHEIVRSDLLPSMLETIHYNLDHFQNDFKLFEISPLDLVDGTRTYLSIGLCGKKSNQLKSQDINYSFFDIKGYITGLLSIIGINQDRVCFSYSLNKSFHPKASADIKIDGKFVGTIGKLHPLIENENIIVGELDLTAIDELVTNKIKFKTFTSISNIKRELSFEIPNNITYDNIITTIINININHLINAELYDIYNKDNNQTYLTVSLTFSSNDEHIALKNEEIDEYIKEIVSTVENKLNIKLRK